MSDGARPPLVIAISAGLSMVPGAGSVLQIVYDEIMAHRRSRADEAMREISETVDMQRIVDRIGQDETLAELLAQALEALARSGYTAKRRVLARAVTWAFENDEAIDGAVLTVRALADLEPVHIRALAELARAGERETAADETQEGERDAVRIVSNSYPVPVLATLIQTGVCVPATLFSGGVVIHSVSPFGHAILQELRAVADEELERLPD